MDKLIHKLKALLEKMDNKKIIYNSIHNFNYWNHIFNNSELFFRL